MKFHLGKIDELNTEKEGIASRDVAIETLKSLLREREENLSILKQKMEQEQKNTSATIEHDTLTAYKIELQKANRIHDMMSIEIAQLREALQRSNIEQSRLIDDKRELEEIIEK